jgi:hypothetical protein
MKSICKSRQHKHSKSTAVSNTLEGFGFHVKSYDPRPFSVTKEQVSCHKVKQDKSNFETFNLDYKMKYPSAEAYHFPAGDPKTSVSPCMDSYWRSQPIREGKPRERED